MSSHLRVSRTQRTFCAVLLLCASSLSQAAIFTVNTTVDPPDSVVSIARCNAGNAGTCSLRDAIYITNRYSPESGRIVFDPTVTQITLTRPIYLNTIQSNVTQYVVDGDGRVVIDGGGTTRLFTMTQPSNSLLTGGGTYRLVGLTLRNGSADRGAALYRGASSGDGTLNGQNKIILDHCRVENNQATDLGGALYLTDPRMSIVDTTFSGNSAVNGGGAIWVRTSIIIDRSTFVGNSSAAGGAIYSDGGGTQITNSTLSGNVATQTNGGGGIFSQAGVLALTNVSLWGNVGLSLLQIGNTGIGNLPPASTIRNTLIENCALFLMTNLSGSNNLTLDPLCQSYPGAGIGLADPQLGPLANNGGPTLTLLPGAGSPAIDAGDDATCADGAGVDNLDQRGAQRPAGAHCDIGAVEVGASFALGVSVVGDGTVSAGTAPAPTSGGIIDCASDTGSCTANYSPNSAVTLTPTPAPGAYFAGWSGDDACSTGIVVMDGDHFCAATFASNAVAGTVMGLTGSGLSLHLDYGSGSEDLPMAANATAFAFQSAVATGAHFSVTVTAQPSSPGQTCEVSNASGTLPAGGVDDVAVSCAINRYTIGGTVSDLAAEGLVLALNGGDDLSVAPGASGFIFASPLDSGSLYAVTIEEQPVGEICALTNANGSVVDTNVSDVAVTCAPALAHISGTAFTLGGSGLSLHLDYGIATEDLPVSGIEFAFASAVPVGATYAISIGTQPSAPAQTCTVLNGSGTLPVNGTDIVLVRCELNTYFIGGHVSGLGAAGLVLSLNGGDELAVASGSNSFVFDTPLVTGSPYSVSIQAQPAGEICTLVNASGWVGDADIVNVDVNCIVSQARLVLSVSDSMEFARYGQVIDYLVTLANNGNAAASAVPVSATYSSAFDVPNASWTCVDGNDGAICAASGSGAFADSVNLPAKRSITWIVRVPILEITTESTAAFGVLAPGASPVIDTDSLVIFRDGWDQIDTGDDL